MPTLDRYVNAVPTVYHHTIMELSILQQHQTTRLNFVHKRSTLSILPQRRTNTKDSSSLKIDWGEKSGLALMKLYIQQQHQTTIETLIVCTPPPSWPPPASAGARTSSSWGAPRPPSAPPPSRRSRGCPRTPCGPCAAIETQCTDRQTDRRTNERDKGELVRLGRGGAARKINS